MMAPSPRTPTGTRTASPSPVPKVPLRSPGLPGAPTPFPVPLLRDCGAQAGLCQPRCSCAKGPCLYLARCARVCRNIWDTGRAPRELRRIRGDSALEMGPVPALCDTLGARHSHRGRWAAVDGTDASPRCDSCSNPTKFSLEIHSSICKHRETLESAG